ncbi:SIMPL domain-containing protein [Dactylosporangium sp. NPDC051541]|uniref:SIMPL domain-containing protein n=1 Tax=Dactylosporangium sp. NPDC051541 TaxID=3363977 RepID=UPI0037919525
MSRSRAAAPVLVALTTLVALSSSLLGGGPAVASAAASADVASAAASPGVASAAASPGVASAAASPVVAAAAAEPSADSVLVTGTGEVSGEPDVLTADFAVETSGAAVDEAMSRATAAATKMRDALLHAGIAKADLQTLNVSVGSQRDDDGGITGYTVGQGITATIRNLPRAGTILSETIAAGGDAARLNGVWYSIDDDTALLAQARKLAFADARAKAELYAHEAGRSLGRVLTVSEVPLADPVSGGFDYRSGAGAPAPMPVPLEPGRERLSVTVTVEWALQPPSASSARL